MDQVVLVMIILVILMNITVKIIEIIYHRISFCILFLSFGYNFNVFSLCSFFKVALFSNVILCFII